MILSSKQLNDMIFTIVNDIRIKAVESDPDIRQQKTNFKVGLDKLNDSINDLKYVMLEHWYDMSHEEQEQ